MSKAMTIKELGVLLRDIDENHSPLRPTKEGLRVVKYVDPHIDMRTRTAFAITLRSYGWERTFHTQNECRDLPESLLERVTAFLKEPK